MRKGFIKRTTAFVVAVALAVSSYSLYKYKEHAGTKEIETFGATILFPIGGGTGTSTKPRADDILIGGNNQVYDVKRLTAGSNVTISTSSSQVIISATGGGGSSFGQDWELTTNLYSQSALRPTTTQNVIINGTGTSTFAGGLEVWRQISSPFFHATSTTASSTLQNTQVNDLKINSLTGILKGINGFVTTAVAGTDYEVPLTFGAGLTRTVNTVDCDTASGTTFGCLTPEDFRSFDGKVASTTTITINGTANQITSSAGAQNLQANRVWTLSLPSHVIFPNSFFSPLASTTHATTSTFYITSLGTPAGSFLAVDPNGQVIGTTTPSSGSGTGSNWQFTTNTFGETAIRPTTTLNIVVNGTGTSTFAGGLSAFRSISTPYFNATSSTDTSTLLGGLSVASNSFNVLQNGNVGIGTSTPGTFLSIGNIGNNTINISPTATSTFGSGINLRTGCFAINGTCISGGGGGSGFGEAWALTTNIYSQSALTPTTTQNIAVNGVGTSTFAGGLEAWRQIASPYFHATSSNATSTFAGGLSSSLGNFNVLQNGHVGVGTNAPIATLDINTSYDGSAGLIVRNDNTVFLHASPQDSFVKIGDVNGVVNATLLTVDDSNNYFLLTNGNVGIGTTTPGSLLSLGNTGNNTINISPTATSTFGQGINLRAGCFSIAGTCISGGGGGGTVTSVDFSVPLGFTIAGNPITTSGTLALGVLFPSNSIIGSNTAGTGLIATGTASSLSVHSINATSTATSTFVNGINLSTGCFSINGTCISGSSGGTSFGEAWSITTNIFGQSALAPTTTQNILVNGIGTSTFAGGLEVFRQVASPYFQATSTTATSTFPRVNISTLLNVTASATSSFSNGINLTAGCFSINGTCVSGGAGSGTVNSGLQGQVAYYASNGTAVSATSTLFFNTTTGALGIGTTTATSTAKATLDGGLYVTSSNGSIAIGNTTGNFSQVATGIRSVSVGWNNLAGSDNSVSIGHSNDASGACSSAFGQANSASGSCSSAFGAINTASGNNSTSFGHLNIASNTYASASGYSNDATGACSSAFGHNNTASVINTSAFGYENTASGYNSSAFGFFNTASGYNTSALGNFNTVSGSCSSGVGRSNVITSSSSGHGFGYSNTVSGDYASAFGQANSASALNAVALGNNNTVSNSYSFGSGNLNQSTGQSSSAVGYGNNATADNASAIGFMNGACGVCSSAFGASNNSLAYQSSTFGFNNITQSGATRGVAVGAGNNVGACNSIAVGFDIINSIDNSAMFGVSDTAKLTILSTGETKAPYFTATSTTASSTFANGINLTAGCFAINGTCISGGGGGGSTFGEAWALTTNIFGQSALAPTTTQNILVNGVGTSTFAGGLSAFRQISSPYFQATSTTATSTFAYDVAITGMLSVLKASNSAVIIGDTTGNTRGTNSVDIQSERTAGTQVASGAQSSAFGNRNTASGIQSSAFGFQNTIIGARSSGSGYDNDASGADSSAFGSNNTASASSASAFGRTNTASNTNTSAFGSNNTANNTQDSAFGHGNTASGSYSSALGNTNTASGGNSSAVGFDNDATAGAANAFGRSNTSNASGASAFGMSNTSSGLYSTAFGRNNTTASGSNFSVAVGYNNTSSAQYATAVGTNVTNGTTNSAMFGASNTAKLTILSTGETQAPFFTATTTNGTSTMQSLVVNNQFAVATTTPWTKFAVNGTVALQGLSTATGQNAICIRANFEIVNAGADTCITSSIQFKDNVASYTGDALDVINKMNVVTFDYKPEYAQLGELPHSIGLIAEEIEKIDPRLVDYDHEGNVLSVHFERVTAYMVKAIQDLSVDKVKRSTEENWQWVAILLLVVWNIGLTRKLKKNEKQN